MGAVATSEKKIAANQRNAKLPRRVRVTADLIQDICEAVRAGVRPITAAALNGVPSSTYYEWWEKGHEKDARPLLREFVDSVELALAEWEAGDILLIGKAARQENPGEWTAAAWRLERRLPSIYAKKPAGTQVNVQVVEAERSDLSARLLLAATRVLGDDPELLARFMAEVEGGEVVVGEAAEVAELAP